MAYSDPNLDTVHDAFMDAARHYGDRAFVQVLNETAAAYGIAPGDWSYAEAAQEIQQLRERYVSNGYQSGDRVALLLENRPAFFAHWFALNGLGVSVVPINPDLRAAELKYIFAHAHPVLAIAIQARVADLKNAVASAEIACLVIADGEVLPSRAKAATQRHVASEPDTPLSREAAILYTSGTTGTPKGCVLSNLYFLSCGTWYSTTAGLCNITTAGERMLTPLPLFHMNAMACSTLAMIAVGGTLIILDRFHPSTWWDSVRESRATCIHYLGVVPTMLMAAPPSSDDRKHTVRFGFGAGVDRRLHDPFEQRFGFPLVEAWAMTETGNGAVIAANHGTRKTGLNCFGRPSADIEVRLLTDSGQDAAPGEPGELLVRRAGDNPRHGFFTEYYRDPAATAEAWLDGWFHTGDVVTRDADGDLVFVDRKNNVIRRSGENIAAVEVESVLLRHPHVAAAAVAAVPDPVRGDEVFACIVAEQTPGDEPSRDTLAQDIVHWALDQLAYYKAPAYVAFVTALPLTSTQKIARAEMRDLAMRMREDVNTVDTRTMKKRS
jgi:acyl-CoA synthetase (AMP-forming)/AMP-acid ligase II